MTGGDQPQIRLLEEDMKQPLFRRLHRGLELTAAGQSCPLDDRRLLPDRLCRRRPEAAAGRGPVKASRPSRSAGCCPAWLSSGACTPASSWRSRPPGTGSSWTGGSDSGVTGCDQPRPPTTPRSSWSKEAIVPVCTPAYARKIGTPGAAADFARPQLAPAPTADRSDSAPVDRRLGSRAARCRPRPDLGTIGLAIHAAKSGLGVAIADVPMLADQIELGQLVTPGAGDRSDRHVELVRLPAQDHRTAGVRRSATGCWPKSKKSKDWSAAWLVHHRR